MMAAAALRCFITVVLSQRSCDVMVTLADNASPRTGPDLNERGGLSIATTARCDFIEPVSLRGFVGPEIDRHFHCGRQPDELLVEIDLGAGFLEPREANFEVPRRSRSHSATHRPPPWRSSGAP